MQQAAMHDMNDMQESAYEMSDYRAFLTECMTTNIEHARHVENERITFLSLYLVGVGLLLGIVLDIIFGEGPLWVALFMSVMLLVINEISMHLLRRWNKVFRGHMETAKRLCSLINRSYDEDAIPEIEQLRYAHGAETNYYYYFSNRPGEVQEAPQRKTLLQHLKYISTSEWFSLFMYAITLIEIVVLIMVVLAFFPPAAAAPAVIPLA